MQESDTRAIRIVSLRMVWRHHRFDGQSWRHTQKTVQVHDPLSVAHNGNKSSPQRPLRRCNHPAASTTVVAATPRSLSVATVIAASGIAPVVAARKPERNPINEPERSMIRCRGTASKCHSACSPEGQIDHLLSPSG